MRARRQQHFATIVTEGAILPADLLARVAAGDGKSIGGLTPDAYHLPGRERIAEATNRSWNRMVGAWASFSTLREALPATDAGTTLTRDKWLLPLFQELGYGRLRTTHAVEIEGRSYPISHGWQKTPIHLVSFRVDIDRRVPGAKGASTASPHALVQELLNCSPDSLWAFVSNGLRLRVLRDNVSLTRQAFVEFDLEAMMDGDVYSDFAVLWMLCHQSRVEVPEGSDRPEACWLERWSQAAEQQGTRVREQLRSGVETAIATLGTGFLCHPANEELRAQLSTGELSRDDYYRQLLRVVYRLLFLFVAEDRGLLLTPGATDDVAAARERYDRFYSTARMRRMAESIRGTRHGDVWRAFATVVAQLGSDEGCSGLALPALGSFLFSAAATGGLDACELENSDMLDAVRALAFTEENRVRRAVDYRNLQSEELGSVYESLLELHPELNVAERTFALDVAAGNERKTTGSYYTPDSLVQCLLDSALEPVLDRAASAKNPEAAILALKVCDPAVGSGHFLVAAAHRMAKRLAAVRTGDAEPAPDAVRAALRDVISRCLFGVDMNPMAVELCKVNLWLEALDPGRPLGFLDHHIQCGNALLGTTPELIAGGIPDAAYKPIEGDDPEVAKAWKARNKSDRQAAANDAGRGLLALMEGPALGDAVRGLEAEDDAEIGGVHRKERRWMEIGGSEALRRERMLADAWCAAFVARKVEDASPITERVLETIRRGDEVSKKLLASIEGLAAQYGLFHWHLAFPQVFGPNGGGGFDVVLGNPPWERVKLAEKEWFAERAPDIAAAVNAAARGRMIRALDDEDPALWGLWRDALRQSDGESTLVRNTGRYPLCGRGDINTYAVFAELNRALMGRDGRAGFIVPTGIATDDTTKFYFQEIVESETLASLFDFENRAGVFPGIDRRMKFCLLTLATSQGSRAAEFSFFAHSTADLNDPDRCFSLTSDDIALINPDTRTCPIFRTRRDAEITRSILGRVPTLGSFLDNDRSWSVRIPQGFFHQTNDAALLYDTGRLGDIGARENPDLTWHLNAQVWVRLFEGRMIGTYNHRAANVAISTENALRSGSGTSATDDQLRDPAFVARPRYWVTSEDAGRRVPSAFHAPWFIGFKDVTSVTNERTMIAAAIPRQSVVYSIRVLMVLNQTSVLSACLLGNLNAFVLDFVCRQKTGGNHITDYIVRQLPILGPDSYKASAPWCPERPVSFWILQRVLELSYTAHDLEPFARDLGYDGPPFVWDPARRFHIRAELDAAFFHLYGLARDDVDYIMDTFPIVRGHDEKAHNEYRTKRAILEIYDRLQDAATTGTPYTTTLSPPPGDPLAAHDASPSRSGRSK